LLKQDANFPLENLILAGNKSFTKPLLRQAAERYEQYLRNIANETTNPINIINFIEGFCN
jgi:hypothetical protein